MSLPSTRRIAKAALLTAAGAASVVGTAGSASALTTDAPDLSGVSSLDGEGLGTTADETLRGTSGLAGETGGDAVRQTLPAAGNIGGAAAKTALPAATDLGNGAKETVGDTTSSATERLGGGEALGGLADVAQKSPVGGAGKLLGGMPIK
ncbi:hypothetical protein [Streptomyces sulphureus]|uniref:hypothetical protein n=1 Tax=Streptomyces sulphureus TaxID=47758 RepID=UPI00035D4EFD|nr:hypothetical protein [Streptomyces sulphureus]